MSNYKFYNDMDYHNTCMLIILKEDKPANIWDEFHLEYDWSKYNHETKKYDYNKSGPIDMEGSYGDNLVFNGKNFFYLNTSFDRLRFAYASLHDDRTIEKIVRKHIPGVTDIFVPSRRYVEKYYLKYWMDKYGFTLEDFIFNNKYIVVCDTYKDDNISKLFDLGLLNWDNIEICSELLEEDDE